VMTRPAFGWAFLVIALVSLRVTAAAAFTAPAFIHEYPHPKPIVQFHPRRQSPFRVVQLEQALGQGAQAVELDVRWRARDSTVVCSHERRDVEEAPTLDDAFRAVARHQGRSATVHHDGKQFFTVLDLKEESHCFERALLRVLSAHATGFSTSSRPDVGPRGITVVVTGFRAALERSAGQALDTLCVVEGREYGPRLRDVSGSGSTFQWIAMDYPLERSRIQDLHEGRDGRAAGRFSVRVVGARGHVIRALEAGADAVNADLDELPSAVRWTRGRGRAERKRP
jgi:hypothetical protein